MAVSTKQLTLLNHLYQLTERRMFMNPVRYIVSVILESAKVILAQNWLKMMELQTDGPTLGTVSTTHSLFVGRDESLVSFRAHNLLSLN